MDNSIIELKVNDMKELLEKKKQELANHLRMNQDRLAQLEAQVVKTKEALLMIFGAIETVEELSKEFDIANAPTPNAPETHEVEIPKKASTQKK